MPQKKCGYFNTRIMFYKQRRNEATGLVFFEILSNIKKITKQQKLGNSTTNLSSNRNLATNKDCFIKNRTIEVYSYVLRWFDF
jgi:hypothetical protein